MTGYSIALSATLVTAGVLATAAYAASNDDQGDDCVNCSADLLEEDPTDFPPATTKSPEFNTPPLEEEVDFMPAPSVVNCCTPDHCEELPFEECIAKTRSQRSLISRTDDAAEPPRILDSLADIIEARPPSHRVQVENCGPTYLEMGAVAGIWGPSTHCEADVDGHRESVYFKMVLDDPTLPLIRDPESGETLDVLLKAAGDGEWVAVYGVAIAIGSGSGGTQ